jgi:hypothetical protein
VLSSVRGLAGRKALAPLLVLTLLLCHGAYGVAHHQYGLAAGPATSTGAHGFSAGAHTTGAADDGGATNEGLGGLAYTAMLLFVLTAAVLWPRSGASPGWGGLPMPRLPQGRRLVTALPCVRGPTLPSLQVFRL